MSWSQLVAFGIADDGTYTIRLRVDDGNGAEDIATTTITVHNVAPVLQNLTITSTD